MVRVLVFDVRIDYFLAKYYLKNTQMDGRTA